MGQLFLSGGGNSEQSFKINSCFVNCIDQDKPLLYIPLAGDPDFRPHESSHQYIVNMFKPLGINEVTMWTDVSDRIVDELSRFSAVYISGGDPIRLLDTFKQTGFNNVLSAYFEAGGAIFGQSAGANVLGETIGFLAQDGHNENQLSALNLLKGYSLWCHYQNYSDSEIKKFVNRFNLSLIAIPEATLVYGNDIGLKVYGTEPVYLFERKKDKVALDKHFQI